MLKNFAEKAIRRDTKHNGRKAPRRMAKTMTPRGFFCLPKGGCLLNHDGGRTFAAILDTLDGLGYGVEWQVLNSKDFDAVSYTHLTLPTILRV